MEANERLVGSLVFKTSGGARVPRRVRFPSASAMIRAVQGAGWHPRSATVGTWLVEDLRGHLCCA